MSAWSTRAARWRARLFYGPIGLAWLRAGLASDVARWRSATLPTSPLLLGAAMILRRVRDAVRSHSVVPKAPAVPTPSTAAPVSAIVRKNVDGDPHVLGFVGITTVEAAMFAIQTWDIVRGELPHFRVCEPVGEVASARALRRLLEGAVVETPAGIEVLVSSERVEGDGSFEAPERAATKICALARDE